LTSTLSALVVGVILVIITEVCGPFCAGRLGCQALKVCKAFCTTGGLKVVFADSVVIVNCNFVLVEALYLGINSAKLLIEFVVTQEICGDAPVFEFVSLFHH
jgi:hypothetical protein